MTYNTIKGDFNESPLIVVGIMSLEQIHRVGGDHQFLVSRNDNNLHFRVVSGNDDLLATSFVLLFVELDAQEMYFLIR